MGLMNLNFSRYINLYPIIQSLLAEFIEKPEQDGVLICFMRDEQGKNFLFHIFFQAQSRFKNIVFVREFFNDFMNRSISLVR